MRKYIAIILLFATQFLKAQGPGEFYPFTGLGTYQVGSLRPASDTNIYFQANGIINENGSRKHVYKFKGLNNFPYELNGVKFHDLYLFYESEKLVRIDLVRVYIDSTEKLKEASRNEHLKNLYSYFNQLSYVQGRKKNFSKSNFAFEKGYQWKRDDKVMQLKNYNLTRSPNQEKMLVISLRYQNY